VSLPAFQAAPAFGPIKQKLNNSQNVVIFVTGDSTSYATSGPYQLFLQQLAKTYNGTAALYLWAEWNNATGQATGSKAYNTVQNTVYGAGPTITMYLCALPGSVSCFPWDSSRKAAALDALPTPDVVIMHQGHNMQSFDVQAGVVTSGDNLVTGRGLLLGTIGMLSLQWPNVPQIMTTQNINHNDAGMANMYGSYLGVSAAMPSLSLQDTYTDFVRLGRPQRLYRPVASDAAQIHPSDGTGTPGFDGAALQSSRLMAAFNLATPGAYTTTSWPATAGTNILTNGDFSNWTGALPVSCSIFNSQTAVKDAAVTYSGSYAYSMRMDAVGRFASLRYTFSGAERPSMLNQTVSIAILFKTNVTYASGNNPFHAVLIADTPSGPLAQWIQGDALMALYGNWYLAVFPGVQIGASLNASASINLYPSLANNPTGGSLWVQKMTMVQGPLPSGPF
jgi:hypothetical protein